MALEDAVNPIKGVSGPGKYAKRIDRMPSNSYGETKQTAELASGAPLAKTADVRPTPLSEITSASQSAQVTPLFAPTQRPGEPVTHGVDVGAGGGANVLSMPAQTDAQYTTAYEMIKQWASDPNASPTMQYLAQRIKQGY